MHKNDIDELKYKIYEFIDNLDNIQKFLDVFYEKTKTNIVFSCVRVDKPFYRPIIFSNKYFSNTTKNYTDNFIMESPFLFNLDKLSTGDVIFSNDKIKFDILKTTDFYNNFMIRNKINYYLVLVAWRDQNKIATFSLALEDTDCVETAFDILEVLKLDITFAFKANAIIDGRNYFDNSLIGFSQTLEANYFLINRNLEIISEKIVDENINFIENGKISFKKKKILERIQEAIKENKNLFFEYFDEENDDYYYVIVTPKSNSAVFNFFYGNLYNIFIRKKKLLENIKKNFVKNYSLTKSERDVASLIITGKSIEEVSDELLRTKESIRTSLKRIFSKTGTHRQGELIYLGLMSSKNSLKNQ